MPEKTEETKDTPLSILVVDDDELNRRMMLLLLKREGHLVECVSNGLEAVNAVKSKNYDLVLMDLQMPVMDGVAASRQIRDWEHNNGHTFIVALTASYMPERGRELYEAGIDNYIAKPFDVDHLRHMLKYGNEERKGRSGVEPEIRKVDPPQVYQEFDHREGIKRVGGNIETYRELLSDFIQELPGKVEGMWSLHKSSDAEGLGRAAHNLKGVSANLGAPQLSEFARRLEKQVSAGYNQQIESMLNDISSAAVKLQERAQSFLVDPPVDDGELR